MDLVKELSFICHEESSITFATCEESLNNCCCLVGNSDVAEDIVKYIAMTLAVVELVRKLWAG
jgi:hypothetical protein